jgi:hypothetical protein
MLYTGDLQGSLPYFFLETLCWVSVGCVVYAYLKRLAAAEHAQSVAAKIK